MCWNGEASAVLAATGVASAAYAALKRNPEPPALWGCLLYFSSMEVLQAVSYTVVNQCDNPLNQILTLFGYLHITFQPFFINAVARSFMPKGFGVADRALCLYRALPWRDLMLVQLYPFGWADVASPAGLSAENCFAPSAANGIWPGSFPRMVSVTVSLMWIGLETAIPLISSRPSRCRHSMAAGVLSCFPISPGLSPRADHLQHQ